jgi:hypothetical protein
MAQILLHLLLILCLFSLQFTLLITGWAPYDRRVYMRLYQTHWHQTQVDICFPIASLRSGFDGHRERDIQVDRTLSSTCSFHCLHNRWLEVQIYKNSLAGLWLDQQWMISDKHTEEEVCKWASPWTSRTFLPFTGSLIAKNKWNKVPNSPVLNSAWLNLSPHSDITQHILLEWQDHPCLEVLFWGSLMRL